MRYLLFLAFLLTACASSPQWQEIEPNVLRMYSLNPDYDCRIELGATDERGTGIRGCHAHLGDTHFIIVSPGDAVALNHELRHVREGAFHD